MEVSKIKKALIDKNIGLTGNLYHKIDFSYNIEGSTITLDETAVFTTQKRF